MFLPVASILIVLAVGYVYLREGLLTGFAMMVNVVIAGIVAFSFFEPIAAGLQESFKGSIADGCEDALSLVFIFSVILGLLRLATNSIANKSLEFPQALQRGGGAVCGLVAGYLVAGFLICVMQTLPWAEDFLDFRYKGDGGAIRSVLPPDRVWLALMARGSVYPFANEEDANAGPNAPPHLKYVSFDKYATFELRYGRYRREQKLTDKSPGDQSGEVKYGPPLPYLGELDKEIHKELQR